LYREPVRYRRADLAWALPLLLSAGLSLSGALTFDGGGWLSLPMAVLAYPAGRRIASLSLALWVFTAVTFTGLALAYWRSTDPLSSWLSVVFVEFIASVLPWWVGRYRRLRAEQREREQDIVAEQARLRERARIAQDMHDSLGHELALIALHGGR
jgi:signal transduction histidine kinase